VTSPDEQARAAFTAEDHVEFEDAPTTSPRTFLRRKYGEDITDYDNPSEFVAATAVAEDDPSAGRGSASDPDDVAEQSMTLPERVEFEASDYDSPAAFLNDKHGVHPGGFDDPSEYQAAVAQRGEQ